MVCLMKSSTLGLGLIPGTSSHFNRLFETSSSPRATSSRQTMQNMVRTTYQESTMSTSLSRQHWIKVFETNFRLISSFSRWPKKSYTGRFLSPDQLRMLQLFAHLWGLWYRLYFEEHRQKHRFPRPSLNLNLLGFGRKVNIHLLLRDKKL